ncbi:hypothetical protein ACOACO_01345 [Nocardioides sp. CPCC 205120]|uniref:hypothetical protein n=1 Tax=Nocardioides sp. CPCC 205120 TaxID=3406462 RepID=UPI003B50EEE0
MDRPRPLVRLASGSVPTETLEAEIARTLVEAPPDEVGRSFGQWLGALWAVGEWLREQHAGPPTGTSTGTSTGTAPTWRRPAWLPAPHRSSLETWGGLMARGEARLHGPLGLDRIRRPAPDLVEIDPGGGSGDPAADVGGVVADLLRLQWLGGRAGADRIPRLVVAFTTSYCGLPATGRLDEVALRRAIALRSAHRAGADDAEASRARLRALVEQSWLRVDG